jgi:hypothetical protein
MSAADSAQDRIDAEITRRMQRAEFLRHHPEYRESAWTLTESQRRARAAQEAAMRAGALNGLPSVFWSQS